MKPNTFTTFSALSIGDRFHFPTDRARVVYQVTGQLHYNQVMEDGRKTMMYDKPAQKDKEVIFLRHTLPQPGQPCRLYDLKQGDIFFFPDNVVLEYEITATAGRQYFIRSVNDKGIGFEKIDCDVVFVKSVKDDKQWHK
jgi:hypothetical protein